MKIEFYRHDIGVDEIESLSKALQGIFLTAGPLTSEFESQFANYIGSQRVVGTFSCTTALFLCLKVLNIGHGDEVITTPLSFIATANSILEAGAKPVFIDVESTTGNIDADLIERAIGPKTKAIIPVHLYGHMCDMKRIREIADVHNLYVIEDAAHCIEGERDGIRPGQLGDTACFSFYATKNITSGEGGAISTNNENLAEKLMLLRSHGMNKEATKRYTENFKHWDMVCMGYKGNMFDMQAALLLPQIPKIQANARRRAQIWATYLRELSQLRNLGVPATLPHTKHAYHLFTIWVDPEKRDEIIVKLQHMGIGVAVNYRPIHLMTYYRSKYYCRQGMFPVAEDIGNRTISLPLYPKMTDEQVSRVCSAVKQILIDNPTCGAPKI